MKQLLVLALIAAVPMPLLQGSPPAPFGPPAAASAAAPVAPVDDVTTIDGIVRAFYDVVSGPAGEAPDRARDEFLHLPGAFIGLSGLGPERQPVLTTMHLEGYHRRFGGVRAAPFYEWEIHRIVERFGNIAQVWTTYVVSNSPGGPVAARGVNAMHLYHDGSRWWIAGWVDERERPDQPIPARYLPAGS
jgi:hypothetical protein